MYIGKCSLKKWVWKPANSHAHGIPTNLKMGVTFARVETHKKNGFSHISELPQGIQMQAQSNVLEFTSNFTESRKESIEQHNALKNYIEANFAEADKAYIAVRKYANQIQVVRCGEK